LLDDGLLVDAGVLVGPLEFRELVDVAAYFARQLPRVVFALDAHDDALGINGIDDAVAARQYHSTGVAGGDTFHAGAHDRSTGAEQWHCLALHVGTHEGSVGVVVLQEGHERGGDRNQLLGTDVDVVNFIAAYQDEVAGLAGVNQVGDDAALVVQLDVGLRDDVAVFFPR